MSSYGDIIVHLRADGPTRLLTPSFAAAVVCICLVVLAGSRCPLRRRLSVGPACAQLFSQIFAYIIAAWTYGRERLRNLLITTLFSVGQQCDSRTSNIGYEMLIIDSSTVLKANKSQQKLCVAISTTHFKACIANSGKCASHIAMRYRLEDELHAYNFYAALITLHADILQ